MCMANLLQHCVICLDDDLQKHRTNLVDVVIIGQGRIMDIKRINFAFG